MTITTHWKRPPFVYIMASKRNGTLYTGVTSNLVKRVWEHREGQVAGFTKRHDVKRLVYFESHGDMYAAITREKRVKKWRREWKVRLIEGMNPEWRDLWETIIGGGSEVAPGAQARNGFPPSRLPAFGGGMTGVGGQDGSDGISRKLVSGDIEWQRS